LKTSGLPVYETRNPYILLNRNAMEIKIRLSTLWIVVMLNMIFADIFSIIVEIVNKDTMDIPGEVKMVMAIAAIITNIPIVMIYLSRTLPHKANRIANIGAALFTMVYIIGGGSMLPHYIVVSVIEIIFLLMIVFYSWK
jgi:Family of unknown function (DUF6326)